MKHAFIKFFLFLIFANPAYYAYAQQPSIIEQMIQLKPSLVEVTATGSGLVERIGNHVRVGSFQNQGAGVIIHESGIIVTNAHVVNKASRVKILFHNGATAYARILRFASDLDLALLKVDHAGPLQSVIITDSAVLKLNDDVFTVGNSPLLKQSITGGRIIGLASSRNAKYSNSYESDFFETSFDLYNGDSGGPLFDRNGHLVGLVTAKLLSKNNSSFAVSANKISRYLAAILKDQVPAENQ